MLWNSRKVCLEHLSCLGPSNSDLESGTLSLGETGKMSPNASAMLRICTLSAWAQLQVSSTQQTYLQKVVQPYRPVLATLWVSSLRDYASVRVDSEFLQDSSSISIDSSHSSLGKEVLLPVCILDCLVDITLIEFTVLSRYMVYNASSSGNIDGGERPPLTRRHGRQRFGP